MQEAARRAKEEEVQKAAEAFRRQEAEFVAAAAWNTDGADEGDAAEEAPDPLSSFARVARQSVSQTRVMRRLTMMSQQERRSMDQQLAAEAARLEALAGQAQV